jgi:predicted RND superfamily exporter protein
MTHFFEKRDPWGNRHSLWLVILMAFVTPICWWSVQQLRLDNDMEKWLPDLDPEMRSVQWTHEQFPIEERILLTWDGSSINDARADKLVELLVGKPDSHGIKRGGLPYVSSVIEPRHVLKVMQENGIEPQEAAKRLEGTILGAGPLRVQLTEIGRSALKKTKRELQSAMRSRFGLELVIQDPTLDLTPLISIPVPGENPETPGETSSPAILSADGKFTDIPVLDHDLQISWRGMRVGSDKTIEVAQWLSDYISEKGERQPLVERTFFAIGSPVALAIGISEAGLADKAETVAAIRIASQLAGIPGESLHLAGSVVSASHLNSEVLKAVWDTSFPLIKLHRRSILLTSALASAAFAFVLLRNIRLAVMVLFVSLLTTFCSMSLVPATGGSMNLVLIVMPTLLIVSTMSGALYVANDWKHAAFHDETRAIVETVHRSWVPCSLASLTTAIGLISLCTSRLAPVREFGIYGAVGAMLSLVMVVYGLPALIQLWPGPSPREHELEHPGWKSFGTLLTLNPGFQSLIVIAICVGLSLGVSRLRTESKVIRYFPEKSKIAQDYWFIETQLAGAMPVENLIRFDDQSQKETNFLDRMELIRQIQEKIRSHSEISGSASLADLQPVNEPLPENAGFLQKSKHNKKAILIQQRIRDGEIENARSFYTISEQGRDLLATGDHQLNQPGDELWRISAQINVMTDHDFSKVLADLHEITQDVLKLQPGASHSITGTVPLSVRTQQAVLQGLFSSFGMAFALIFVVFIVMLRSFGAALVAMIPNLLPITVVIGVFSWLHQRIDIGSMMTASIGLGIAVDGTLHYLTWFQHSMKKGRSRRESIIEALAHCGPVVCQTNITIILGLLVLVPAELRLISQFGGMMASIIAISLLGNLVLMPQLLGGPLGALFEPKKSIVGGESAQLSASKDGPAEQMTSTSSEDDGKGPPPPHIKPIDPTRKKRRPTA